MFGTCLEKRYATPLVAVVRYIMHGKRYHRRADVRTAPESRTSADRHVSQNLCISANINGQQQCSFTARHDDKKRTTERRKMHKHIELLTTKNDRPEKIPCLQFFPSETENYDYRQSKKYKIIAKKL